MNPLPLVFTSEELEALALGARWVEARPDAALARAAKTALGKIAAASPDTLRDRIEDAGLWPVRSQAPREDDPLLALIREAMRSETVLHLAYADETGEASQRAIWPLILAYYEDKTIVVAWCTLRQNFRHFRVDRVRSARLGEERFGRRRAALVKAWEEGWLARRRAERLRRARSGAEPSPRPAVPSG